MKNVLKYALSSLSTFIMREQLQQVITELLREHDAIPYEDQRTRNCLQRKILFLMEEIKLDERLTTH